MVDGALIQIFVCFYLISVLISDADEEEAALPAVYGDLADGLVEALIEELLAHRTQPDLPRLPVDQPLLQFLVQLDDFDLGGGGRQHGLHPQLPVVGAVLLGREDLAEDVLCVVLLLLLLGLGVLCGFGRAAHQDWSGVFD